jgi:hypothetical protein
MVFANEKDLGMASKNKKSKLAVKSVPQSADNIYILKLVLYLIIGSQWLRITKGTITVPIPIGLAIGVLFARMDRFSVDRKIEYAVLLVSMFIGFWLPLGLEIIL